jgi:putative DNA primase/helicase
MSLSETRLLPHSPGRGTVADAEADPADEWNSWVQPTELTVDPPEPPAEGVTPLGFDREFNYYFSRARKQVVALTAQQHTEAYFVNMASIAHHWSRTKYLGAKGKINWDEARAELMDQCRQVGIYDPDRIRGRGAWLDQGRAVLHLGDRLIVDGVRCPLMLPGSTAIYEAALPMLRDLPDPLPTSEANKLVKICARLHWERPISGTLLAGWLAIAPICGGLAWRPSIWLTGPTGSGKSYVYDNIVRSCLKGVGLFVGSTTTSNGISQALGTEARPVAFDEAEAEHNLAQQRIQAILELIRQSSSEGGGDILKGQSNHIAKKFSIRSCFVMVSINVSLHHKADESRVTVLSMAKHDSNAEEFRQLNETVQSTLTPEYTAGLVVRSAELLPTIRKNAETFAIAVALKLGSRRAGDQLGALLAGAHSLYSKRAITAEEATKFVEAHDWTDIQPDVEETDERRLLARITQHKVRISLGNGSATECTLGRLVQAAQGHDDRIAADTADLELCQIGVKVLEDTLLVSTSHPALKRLLEGSPWAAGWSRALLRLPDAEPSRKTVRFGPGFVSKATMLPMVAFTGEVGAL